ncbi:MAG: fumarate hydratase [Leptospiraceae bacterium]|nr:fumarate hydratase [Leptospiraceae bacterium]
MKTIQEADIIESVDRALQFISYYHPEDFIKAMTAAYEREESQQAKSAMAQILINSRMSAIGKRPICQDTGIIVAFVKVGMNIRIDSNRDLNEIINEGVSRAYNNKDNPLRHSVVSDPFGTRKNTKNNGPAIIHTELVAGDHFEVHIAAKGGGSENKSKFTILNPSASIVDWIEATIPSMGAGWCPPGMLGIGVGGTAEKAMLLAKESLMQSIDMPELLQRGPANKLEETRIEIYNKVNALGIGAQGLGGLTTVLDVKIMEYPTHAASLPVAMIPNCAATRHIHFHLDGNGPAEFHPPSLDIWPDLKIDPAQGGRRVNLDTITAEEVQNFKIGETLLLSGKMLTGRDAAHKRIHSLIKSGQGLPDGLSFKNRFIYYVGPVDPVRDEVVGPAGPTTSTRMDPFTEFMLAETGLMGMIGKAERGQIAIDAIEKHKSVYLIAVGGAAYLVSKAIRSSKVVAFEDLGMEAVYEFEVEDMPVMVAVDSRGESIHKKGPVAWKRSA